MDQRDQCLTDDESEQLLEHAMDDYLENQQRLERLSSGVSDSYTPLTSVLQ
jgi:hypothetical protein